MKRDSTISTVSNAASQPAHKAQRRAAPKSSASRATRSGNTVPHSAGNKRIHK